MSTLYLPLKKEWFKKIDAGDKTTEYREYKDYWIKRLRRSLLAFQGKRFEKIKGKLYDEVMFSLGYGCKTMTFVIDNISVVDCKDTDLSIDKPVFAIKLGRRLSPRGKYIN